MSPEKLSYEAQEGSLAVLPAGIDATCDRSADATSLLIYVEPGRLALAAAEESAFADELVDRMTGTTPTCCIWAD